LKSVSFVLFCAFSLCAFAQDQGIRYDVSIRGVDNSALRDILNGVSECVQLKDRHPASLALLRRRAQNDKPKLEQALHSEGYYGCSVQLGIDTKSEPVRVTFTVAPGPLYKLDQINVDWGGHTPVPAARVKPDTLGIKSGDSARARAIIDAGDAVLAHLKRHGYPYPSLAKRDVVVDHATHKVNVTYSIDPGARAHFGPTTFKGLRTVHEDYLQNKLPWKPGDPYDSDKVVAARKMLAELGLFQSFDVAIASSVEPSGALPVTIEVTESKHRTIAAGISFKTEEGAGASVSWEHRNITGRGDTLSIEAHASNLSSGLRTTYLRPEFQRPDQSLTAKLDAGVEQPDAYTSHKVSAEIHITRTLSKQLTASAGIGLKTARVEQQDETDQYSLLYFPLRGRWDRRDNRTDPHKGGMLTLHFTPYFGTGDADSYFFKTTAEYRHYVKITDKLVLAGRTKIGTILGASRDGVPPDERFYAGGGSSVRGYDYATLSPLDDKDPIGGRSLFEVSMEARRRLNDTVGLVLFVDGGEAFESTYPDFSETLRWGTGVGVRVFTPAGPLRIDFAVPLNPRDGVDNAFQIYASFGHSF